MPAALLHPDRQTHLADALLAATRHWKVSFHFNKGLAGGTSRARAQAADTSMNPTVLDAFALAISGSGGPSAWPGIAGHEPDLADGRARAGDVRQAMEELRKLAPNAGTYVSESGYFDKNWQNA